MDGIEMTHPKFLKETVREMLHNANLSMAKAVKKSNESFPDMPLAESNISNKFNRGTLRFDEVYLIAAACGYKIKFEPKEAVEPDDTMAKLDAKFKEKCMEHFVTISSPKFDNIVIAGAKAELAANEYINRMNKQGNVFQMATEAKIQADISTEFDVIIRCVPNPAC